ncbi:MAG: MarR family winged helix-turn-helix transcriptional regulator [Candidatus Acidiferrales bacterium]
MKSLRRQPPKKKQRLAWAAYLELTDAAHWIEAKLRVPLDVFGLSREEFRLMVLLHRNGQLKLSEAEAKLGRTRESMFVTIQRAEEFGWVRRGITHLPAAEVRASRLPTERRDKPRLGRQVGTVELTPQGETLIGKVLPKQEGILRALMGELDSREMESLIRICGKIRREDDATKIRYAAELSRASGRFDGEEQGGEPETQSSGVKA